MLLLKVPRAAGAQFLQMLPLSATCVVRRTVCVIRPRRHRAMDRARSPAPADCAFRITLVLRHVLRARARVAERLTGALKAAAAGNNTGVRPTGVSGFKGTTRTQNNRLLKNLTA